MRLVDPRTREMVDGRPRLGRLPVTITVEHAAVGYHVREASRGLSPDVLRWRPTRRRADAVLARLVGRRVLADGMVPDADECSCPPTTTGEGMVSN